LTKYSPDVLAKGLSVVFCGLNPATSAVADGYNFSNPSNRFWTVLHLAGFTDVRLKPQEERSLLDYGCGISAVVTRPTKRAAEVAPEEFRQARAAFEAKMNRYGPRSIAFLGKAALAAMVGQRNVNWGGQSIQVAGALVWVLPNPSGLNRGFSLDALVQAYSELRVAIALPSRASAAAWKQM
jgi:TDG/mug DNA glycosylase family protein